MKASAACLSIIRDSEGCKLKAYICPSGIPTVGWGHTGPEVHKDLCWTQAQADAALREDVAKFAAGVEKALEGAKTTQPQFDALVSFAFNLGVERLAKSTLLKRHKEGNWPLAADQFHLWVIGGPPGQKRVLPGLVKRRDKEAALYRKGQP